MWIRSQDKKVLKDCDEFSACLATIFGVKGESNIPDTLPNELGKYDTEERAIEVLDQIQRRIQIIEDEKLDCMFYDGKFEKPTGTDKTFEMPAE